MIGSWLISTILNEYAQLKSTYVPSHTFPWFTTDPRAIKTKGWHLERLWKKT